MAQELRVFPHIPLRFVAEGRAKRRNLVQTRVRTKTLNFLK
jgi:hypothetical protein